MPARPGQRFFPRDVRNDHHGRRSRLGAPAHHRRSPPARSPPSPSIPPIRARSTSRWAPPSGPPYDAGGTWQKSADLRGRTRQIWIDPRSPRGDRTLYVAGPDALYIRRDGRWRTTPLPGTLTDIGGAPPVFYATVAGKIYVSTDGGVTWRESALPGFQGQAAAIAASRGSIPRSPTSPTADCARRSAPPGAWPRPPIPGATGSRSTTTCATPG